MQRLIRPTRTEGFTLVELMMVVALIGVLTAIAIPQFMAYQARSRRSEAYMNLQALANHEKTYAAERDQYYDTGAIPMPNFVPYGGLGAHKMTWDAASEGAFGPLGWKPEGRVFYSYEVNTTANCDAGCVNCFTASAFGDVDDDGFPSAVMFVMPELEIDGTLSKCKSKMFSFGVPSNFSTGVDVYRQVAVNRSIDEY